MPWKALNVMYRHMAQCTWGVERKRRQLAAEDEREVTAKAFSAYGRPLEMVNSFRYLGRVILAARNNWMAVVKNLSRAR